MFIDTHCHLDFPEFNLDREQVIKRAYDQGISQIINIGSSLLGSQKSVSLSEEFSCIYAAVGIHPHEADSFSQKEADALFMLAKKEKVVAIGETGLDYYKNYSKIENQKLLFQSLIKLAKDSGLPLVVHTRQAETDTLKFLKEAMPIRAVVHCFSGDEDFLRECLALGFFISFTGNITYPKAQNLRSLVKAAPLEKFFLETDAPFLAPQEFRGRRNEPAYVKLVAEEIAKIKKISVQEVAEATTQNAKEFFNLK